MVLSHFYILLILLEDLKDMRLYVHVLIIEVVFGLRVGKKSKLQNQIHNYLNPY